MFSKEFLTKYTALTEKLNESLNRGDKGTLIVLEADPHDYLLSQLIHLMEQNNAQVLHVFSYFDEETSKQVVMVKIDLEDASYVLRSLERFNYNVVYHEQKQPVTDEIMLNRFNELMYYLEI